MLTFTLKEELFNLYRYLDPHGMLLVSGKGEDVSVMTLSWGQFGVLWDRPVITIAVKPLRHTHSFLLRHSDFTLNALPESASEILGCCGHHSGKNVDKLKLCKVELEDSSTVLSPRVRGASMVFECKIIYSSRFQKEGFRDPTLLEGEYRDELFHTQFVGEITDFYRDGE